jgi:hypothetical protein
MHGAFLGNVAPHQIGGLAGLDRGQARLQTFNGSHQRRDASVFLSGLRRTRNDACQATATKIPRVTVMLALPQASEACCNL